MKKYKKSGVLESEKWVFKFFYLLRSLNPDWEGKFPSTEVEQSLVIDEFQKISDGLSGISLDRDNVRFRPGSSEVNVPVLITDHDNVFKFIDQVLDSEKIGNNRGNDWKISLVLTTLQGNETE